MRGRVKLFDRQIVVTFLFLPFSCFSFHLSSFSLPSLAHFHTFFPFRIGTLHSPRSIPIAHTNYCPWSVAFDVRFELALPLLRHPFLALVGAAFIDIVHSVPGEDLRHLSRNLVPLEQFL